jgi:putative ABC transport system permease protein
LTTFGIMIAIFLFCILEAILWAFTAGVEASDASRLVVRHKESLVFDLPLNYVNKVKSIKGINGVSHANWFGGIHEEKKDMFFAQFAADLETYLPLYPEIEINNDEKAALMSDRQGCVIGEDLARDLKKKVGDTVRLKGTIWPANNEQNLWDFNIRAIYTSKRKAVDKKMMFFHWDYLNEGRRDKDSRDSVGFMLLKIDDPSDAARISTEVDKLFEFSDERTFCMTEKAFNLEFVSMMGNLSLLIRVFGTVVVFTILLISVNTNMMNARERIGEVGLLKALGFSPKYIFKLFLAESFLICFMGGVIGLSLAFFMINVKGWNPNEQFFPLFNLPNLTIAFALILSALTGILSGLTPALASARMSASEALRSV